MIELKRILLATDLSEFSKHAVKHACELAERFGAELHVLYVSAELLPTADWSNPPLDEHLRELQRQETEALANFVPADWQESHRVVQVMLEGKAYEEIIRYAKERQMDMIVLTTHGRSGLSQLLIGGTAERVVRLAPCPVLTVRPEGQQLATP